MSLSLGNLHFLSKWISAATAVVASFAGILTRIVMGLPGVAEFASTDAGYRRRREGLT